MNEYVTWQKIGTSVVIIAEKLIFYSFYNRKISNNYDVFYADAV